jgi:hypothetical protein
VTLTRVEWWRTDGTYNYRRGRSAYKNIPDAFVLKTTMPTAANSGAGVIRPFPTEVINGDVTVPTGTVLADKVINGKVNLVGTAALENCYLRGPLDGSVGDQRTIVRCDSATGNFTGAVDVRDVNFVGAVGSTDTTGPGGHSNNIPVPNVRFCTIEPSNPTAYMGGIGNKNYYAYRCKMREVVDGFAVFASSPFLSNTRGEGNFVESLAQFRPDPANGNRSHTHNDVVQYQGNQGGPLDSIWIGNHFNGRRSTTAGTLPVETTPNFIATFTISVAPAVGAGEVNTYVEKNWLEGSTQIFNGGSPDNAAGEVTVISNLFERPGLAPDGPTRSLVIHSNSTRITTPPNYYLDDGVTVVPVGNS